MTLRIGTTPYSQWQVLAPLLECLSWSDNQEINPELWHQGIANFSANDQMLLLHTRPETAIAAAMALGIEPDTALGEWKVAAEQMIAFYKRNRRTAALVEVSDALGHPQSCVDILKDHFSLSVFGAAPGLPALDIEPTVDQLLACQLVAQTEDLVSILAELEACTLPLSHTTFAMPVLNIPLLVRQLKGEVALQLKNQEEVEAQRSRLIEAESNLKSAAEENELVLLQLCQVQEELEHYYLQNKEFENTASSIEEKGAELAGLNVKIDVRDQKLERLGQAQKETKEAKALLEELLQLVSTQQGIRDEDKIARLNAQISVKNQALKKVGNTTEFYLYTIQERCLASPLSDEMILEKGLLPEACAGEFSEGKEAATVANFLRNETFVKFLHWVISKHAPQYPALSVVAEQKLSGESQVPDLRGLSATGELADEDAIGVVEFENGKIISFAGNDNYSPFTEKGFMQLDSWFHEKYMEELTEYVNNQALKTE